jgi:hypothetical protein
MYQSFHFSIFLQVFGSEFESRTMRNFLLFKVGTPSSGVLLMGDVDDDDDSDDDDDEYMMDDDEYEHDW